MRLVLLVPPERDREAEEAVEWANAHGYDVVVAPLREDAPVTAGAQDVVWCHAEGESLVLPSALGAALSTWVQHGGAVLLSSLATRLAPALGAPDERPQVQRVAAWRHDDDPLWDAGFRDWPDYPHIRGAQGCGPHPLFDGLPNGTYTWAATEGEAVTRSVFVAPHWPSGDVIAVDRAYVRLDAATAVAWEYAIGAGLVLCLGANVALTAADTRCAAQRDRYLINALAYLDPARDRTRSRRCVWPRATHRARSHARVELVPNTASRDTVAPSLPASAGMPYGALELAGPVHDDAPFTIAGQRTLVTGDERGGVRECWVHPLCVVSEGMQLTVDGDPLRAERIRVTPGAVERMLVDARGGTWREVVATSAEQPIIHYELEPVRVDQTARLQLSCSTRLRLQWPFPSDALHPLDVEWSGADAGGAHSGGARAGTATLHVRAADDQSEARLLVTGAQAVRCVSDGVAPVLTAIGAAGGGLRLAVVASARGTVAIEQALRTLSHTPLATTLEHRAARDEARRAASVRVRTSSPDFDHAWEWAKARLASFVVLVPGVGTGLTAGYASSRPGWGDSRPGYAWFFGRDACWSGDALLAAGMFAEARCALEFLASTIDVTGKVAHEVTTSGVAHYDAADATPLWLRFIAAYAEWTGDLATVRSHWEQVRAAFACVLSHDRDDDGLPENTGVGHGWVESGPLGGGQVTSYVAAIWIDALRRLAPLAERLGDHHVSARVMAACERAERGFERRLRDAATGRVHLQLAADGTPASDLTALSAVPILLGVDREASADDMVGALSAADFAAPWGVRMISRGDARYRPRGYHFGAVWPLYTGWVSLAAFARGRADLGWQHLASVARCAFARQRGAFDEVLDGDTGAAAGICPDQAWSAAMAISPFIYGMLGMQPMAADARCTLRPCWPRDWDRARVEGIRVGRSRFSVAMQRVEDHGTPAHRYALRLESGPSIDIRFGTASDARVVSLVDDRDVVVVVACTAGGRPDGQR